ncbi:DUF559 domain-containing protein [Lusitaniella coriacea LEGE 07157]|uniref:DUF559 domain-containing protein n=1 Tax=Lusitaniella coriacea LEGE 07157 TaxID=945747 RepID=A0A8J7E1V3_9CYAN|nr:DUF559 domain-containing protein [Lusitaniella coriacea]MBE9119116.1 DUF559 domain-containing protein [Lusitaniella coriacea LEGE 07157]
MTQLFENSKEVFDAGFFNKKVGHEYIGKEYIHEGQFSIKYAGKRETPNHHYTIEAVRKKDEGRLGDVVLKVYKDAKALDAIWGRRNRAHYKNMGFESPAEVAVAIEFSRRKILFFSNPTCLIEDRSGVPVTRRPDFLVVYKGQTRILEVDGGQYHQNALEDYRRDRLFERHGLRVTRFTADECLTHPELVVDEFLELFSLGNHADIAFEKMLREQQRTIRLD